MNRIIIIFALLLISFSSCIIIPNNDYEWTYPEISGYLIDSTTNLPIENAIVFEKNYGDTIKSDSIGYFNFKAQKKFIKYKIFAMDPPKPFIDLKIVKGGYLSKEISIRYKKVDYNRMKPDTIKLKIINMKK